LVNININYDVYLNIKIICIMNNDNMKIVFFISKNIIIIITYVFKIWTEKFDFFTSYTELRAIILHVHFFIFSFNFLYTYVILQICKDIKV